MNFVILLAPDFIEEKVKIETNVYIGQKRKTGGIFESVESRVKVNKE